MLWEGKPLDEIHEADVRALIESGLEEHLQLDYKSALYESNDRGKRELLLDVCMFANTVGGLLLLGIPEKRDDQGQPTGAPDPDATIGLELPNSGTVLSAYDASVTAAIEERLPLQLAAIDVGNGRQVLVVRVPNSTSKPHSVQYQGHIYFPARRERQRYAMSVREIKELVMRTTSRLEQAEQLLNGAFHRVERQRFVPYLMIGIIPIFNQDFLVDVRSDGVHKALDGFKKAEYTDIEFSFDGLVRREKNSEYTVRFSRNGLLSLSLQAPLYLKKDEKDKDVLLIGNVDSQLRRFVLRAREVYEAASVSPPYLLGMMLRTQTGLTGGYAMGDGHLYHALTIPGMDYSFPYVQVDDLSNVDQIIRPLCDQLHQTFGREGSSSFNAAGDWVGR